MVKLFENNVVVFLELLAADERIYNKHFQKPK